MATIVLDRHDVACLHKHRVWLRESPRTTRQRDLEAAGLLDGELRFVRQTRDGSREYAKHYRLNAAGLAAIKGWEEGTSDAR